MFKILHYKIFFTNPKMILNYTKNDDDLKFLFHYFDNSITFNKSEDLSLVDLEKITDFDQIIEKLYTIAKEEFNKKKLAEFKKCRSKPVANLKEINILNLLNYINLVKETITAGSLKNKTVIQDFTLLIKDKCNFDPEFYYLELRSGKIENIYEAPEMDKIFCEEVLTNKKYFICSGLREYYDKNDLKNNVYLFLLNIKKAKFKNFESEGMICCAESGKVEAIHLKDIKVGERIILEDMIQLFEDIEYAKVDFSKASYKSIFSKFMIVNHHLTFKGRKVIIDGSYIKTEACDSIVR